MSRAQFDFKLSIAERIQLAEDLWDSIDRLDAGLERYWDDKVLIDEING